MGLPVMGKPIMVTPPEYWSFIFSIGGVPILLTEVLILYLSIYVATTVMTLLTCASINTNVAVFAPEISTPFDFHWYVSETFPSWSSMSFCAVNVWSCLGMPVIVTPPLGIWFTCVTAMFISANVLDSPSNLSLIDTLNAGNNPDVYNAGVQ